jgi:hypothetical protein
VHGGVLQKSVGALAAAARFSATKGARRAVFCKSATDGWDREAAENCSVKSQKKVDFKVNICLCSRLAVQNTEREQQ